jgi:3-hydroxyacyl-CoA dehydrogenase, NAD binding domain
MPRGGDSRPSTLIGRRVHDASRDFAGGGRLSVLAGLFRVGDLPPFVSSGRPVLALHFFNPAPAMKLLEVDELMRTGAGFHDYSEKGSA